MDEPDNVKKPKKPRILSDYNNSVVPPPIGRNNPGVYCFFNAMISVLYSCPIFIERMIEASENPESHSFCRSFIQEYDIVKKYEPKEVIKTSNLVDRLMVGLKNSKNTKDIDFYKRVQQSDVIECLEHMIEMLKPSNPEIGNIFRYRYKKIYKCAKCRQIWKYEKKEELIHRLFKIHPTNNPADSNDDIFISNLEEYISKYDDHCCPICNGWKKSASDDEEEHDTTNAIHTSGITKETLAIIPEVLGIQINHNWNKTIGKNIKKNQYFPMELKFKKKGEDAYLHYKLVGQIEQSGSTTGGHYWARCLRNGEVYIINDTSVRKSRFECTPETCFIIYHHYLPTK